MSNFNKIFLMGRLTRDPELRYTPQGVPVSDLGLAVNRKFGAAGGERREETLFIDATVWRKQAELCCQYLRKGSPIFVEGRLSMDTWDGQDGQRRTRYRVVVDNFQFVGGGGGRRDEGGEAPDYVEGGAPGGGAEAPEPPPERAYGANPRQGGGSGYSPNRIASAPSSAPAAAENAAPDDDIPF